MGPKQKTASSSKSPTTSKKLSSPKTKVVRTGRPGRPKVLIVSDDESDSEEEDEEDDDDEEDEDDEDEEVKNPEPEMKRYADEKNKLQCISGIFNKKRPAAPSTDNVKKLKNMKANEDTKLKKKIESTTKAVKTQPDVSKLKNDRTKLIDLVEIDTDSEPQRKKNFKETKGNSTSHILTDSKKKIQAKTKKVRDPSESESEPETKVKKTKKDVSPSESETEVKKNTSKIIKHSKRSESESEFDKTNLIKKVDTKQKGKAKKSDSDSEEEIDASKTDKSKDKRRKSVDSEEKEKYKKVPCDLCGRQMANEFVLQYHKLRCPGAKKRPSIEGQSSNPDVSEKKKVKKNVEAEKEKTEIKKIDNPRLWGFGELKDIYTDRRKKKIDYLEVSDVEESEESDVEDEPPKPPHPAPKAKKNLKRKESRVSSSSDDDSEEEESLTAKKKILKKKASKPTKAAEKKPKPVFAKSIAVQIFKGKRKDETTEEEEEDEEDVKITNEDKNTNKNVKKQKNETLPVIEEQMLPKQKPVKKKSPARSQENMVTSDSEPEIVK